MLTKVNPKVLILIYCVLSSFLLVANNSFNYLGWAIFGITQVTFVIVSKSKMSKLDWFFAIIGVLCAINFAVYVNPLTLLFSTITFLYALGWLITKLPQDRFLQVFHLILPYLCAFISICSSKDNLPNLFFESAKLEIVPKIVETKLEIDLEPKPNSHLIVNLIITVFILAIIVPLLSFANPRFGQYIADVINLQWIKDIINWIAQTILSPVMLVRIIVIVCLYNFLPRLYTYCQTDTPLNLKFKSDFPVSIPKIATIMTLFAFLLVQLQTTLQPGLLTKSAGNIASETFFHLSVVCFVAFGLIYLNFKDKVSTKIWSLILLTQTLILAIIAFNSDWSYIINWGLTHKRLYGFSILTKVIGVITIFTYYIFYNNKKMIQTFAIWFCAVSVITNMINFDNLIYDNPPKEATGIEQDYVSSLSLDSKSLGQRYQVLASQVKAMQPQDAYNCSEPSWLYKYNNQINFLKEKYKFTRFLDWNYSEYSNYLNVKNIEQYNNGQSTPSFYNQANNAPKNLDCYKRVINFSSFD